MAMKRIAIAIIGLALLTGACGDPAGSSNPLATIVLAADKTQEAGTARMSMDMVMDGPTGLVESSGEGVLDMGAGSVQLSMEMEMPDAPAGTPDMGTIEAVFEGTMMYMKMPALSSQLPSGKPWVSFDFQKIGEEMGMDMGALMQAGGSDPTQSMQYLRGASGEVQTLGEEEVRGFATTHYRATIVFDKIVEQAPADLRDRLEPTVDLIKEWAGTDEMPVEVWIDDQGRMIRQRQSFEYVAGPAAGTSMDMTLEMYDFGVDAQIEAPPAAQVTDLRELMKGMP